VSPATVRIVDETLRDGSNAISHSLTPDQVRRVAGLLDQAGAWAIAVGHGDGLGGASLQFGLATHSDEELLRAAAEVVKHAKIAVALLPGCGTKDDLLSAAASGASLVRVATVCTEPDIGLQHIKLARSLGLGAHGILAMANIGSPELLAEGALILAEAGAQAIYIVDSAGSLLPQEVRDRVGAVRAALPDDIDVGIHAHNNLSLAVANSVAAVEAGATMVDATLAGLGAGAGNTQSEAFVAVCKRLGIETGIDLFALQDAADDVVRVDLMRSPNVVDKVTATLGYAGVPSSFLRHVEQAAERFGVDGRAIIVALGERKVVIGQEDMILDTAMSLAGRSPEPTTRRYPSPTL